MNDPVRARIQVLLAAVLFSTGGAGIKLTSLSAWQVAGLRSLVAAAVFLAVAPGAARGLASRRIWLVASAYGTTMLLFVVANKLTTAANTIFLQSTAPLYVLVAGPLLLGEPLRRRDLSFMAALAFGLGLLFVGREPALTTAPRPFLGNCLAVVSGASWGLTITGLRWLAREEGRGPFAALVGGNLMAGAACLPWMWPIGNVAALDIAVVLHLGVFQIALAYFFLASGVRRVGAFEAALLLLLEPVLNPVWAWLIHGEVPGDWALLGGATILTATVWKTAADARRARGLG